MKFSRGSRSHRSNLPVFNPSSVSSYENSNDESIKKSKNFIKLVNKKGISTSNNDYYGSEQLKAYNDIKNIAKGNTKIDLHDIQTSIDLLSNNQFMTITEGDNNPSIKTSFQKLQQAAAKLEGTKYYQSWIIDPLQKKTVHTLYPGTYGQFLFGALLKDYGDASDECSPISLGSLPNPTKTNLDCERQVWYYQDKEYRRLNSGKHSQADIYVPIFFSGLSPSEIQHFKYHSVKKVNIYTLLTNGSAENLTSILRAKQVPLHKTSKDKLPEYFIQTGEDKITKYQQESLNQLIQDIKNGNSDRWVSSNDNSLALLVLIIAVIIIFLIIAFQYKRK